MIGHAPRERVSWNILRRRKQKSVYVTLHVSVWVEIMSLLKPIVNRSVTLHVSVWVEMLLNTQTAGVKLVTLHVSVWVEIVCDNAIVDNGRVTLHVSVWVEISSVGSSSVGSSRHAPRERVSWNELKKRIVYSFEVTLHVSVWVEIVIIIYYAW